MKTAAMFPHIECDGYRNINSIIKVNDRLHCSETLFGDLNAKLLVLGQDAAPFDKIQDLVTQYGAAGYRHGDKVKTNINLVTCLSDYLTSGANVQNSIEAKSCGVFYANAVWLLKTSKGMAGNLLNKNKVLEDCEEIFKATVEGLPKLKLIIALGKTAYHSVKRISPELSLNWREAVSSRSVRDIELFGKRILVASVLHPSPLSGGKNIPKLKADFKAILQKADLL